MSTATPPEALQPEGAIVELDGEPYYRIAHSDRLPPFLMSIASDTDLWMFVASNGHLTAGRTDADGSLFPYETEDHLYEAHAASGPVTLIRVREGGRERLWRPFAAGPQDPHVERRLYKHLVGHQVVFEEIHHALGLAFRCRWSASERFGIVRSLRLTRVEGGAVEVDVLDGLRNVLPAGVPLALYQTRSSLVDAYRRSELDAATGLGIFSLSAKITDRAEAVESLRANVVWCAGLDRPRLTLSDEAIAAFAEGRALEPETLRTGRRGHYLATASLRLAAGASATWHMAADAGRGPLEIAHLAGALRSGHVSGEEVERALDEVTAALRRNVGSADGLQHTGRPVVAAHHFANVLFNNMRGGVFADGYRAPRADVLDFFRTRNRAVTERHRALLEALPDPLDVIALVEAATATGDADLQRLSLEYLPLTFGRRHGDPSRPWNRFSIRPARADGRPALYYEGNWRDVFQNWEALATSFPRYLPAMVAKFVNASTVDGFNPYRIDRDGVDWEVPDPDDPWSHIGYWGDHQTIYLQRLLEALQRFDPAALARMLDRPVFSYADVPYRLRSYAAMLADPHATLDFDAALNAKIAARVAALGTDGRLVADPAGTIRHATLIEKLLVSALARLSSYVAGGGIWMNTQRPEWNDANNALAGNGVSTVTLCYLRRALRFFADRLAERGAAPVAVAAGVARWAQAIRAILVRRRPSNGDGPGDDAGRKELLDALGAAFETYRNEAYAGRGTEATTVAPADLRALLDAALMHLDHTIAHSRRADGLYHAYHVIGETSGDTLALHPLYEMLEGQVAVLSAGTLTPAEAARLVDALFESRMYDPARRSFMLYPVREPPGFLEKNVVPLEGARGIGLLRDMLAAGDPAIVALDADGVCRFHPDFEQACLLAGRLETLGRERRWAEAVQRDRRAVLELYEAVFHHRAFTGRSGTMYGYEGIGCIYWHMVAKLLVAVQEQARRAQDAGDPAAAGLIESYRKIRAGLGYEKTPSEWGAFPTDPYSHTPRHAGARQPGMTGQVKEEILTRFGELGVRVEGGTVRFRPWMLDRDEYLAAPATFRFVDAAGKACALDLPERSLAFTLCQVPVRYRQAGAHAWVRVRFTDGRNVQTPGDGLDPEAARSIFERRGEVAQVDVRVPDPDHARI